ncbi:hypothetical protein QFC22_002775 [Naganishia vaughanmartiniae]|uniref:Uncharacterized protein n=1 Tax=Naganishia vaughanmartiniae TaxID=1424756 RepID=A0ACC2XBV3_9TREE|nr:hypothetical protein QFC22_002775 [Naganishia vaughanmartiniae]
MSPFSFLSSFAFPTFPTISVPDIGSYLPENIQKRLVSYLLQRTLGKFVKKDGLQLERIEAEINQGRIRLEGLQIDVESVNATLPANSAYRIREGYLDVIDISLPFPNVWSGPLSLNVSSIQVVLETLPITSSTSARASGEEASPEWDLSQSLYVASDDFVRTVLNEEEERQLHKSVHGFRRTVSQESTAFDLDPFALDDEDPFSAPGAFPTRTAAGHNDDYQGGSAAALVESLIETLLARLQVVVNQVGVRYHHEGSSSKHVGRPNIDVDLRLDGIRYALNQSNPTAEPKKTLTIDDLSIWLANRKGRDEKASDVSIPSLGPGKKDEIDMMMSLGIADLRQSRYVQESITGSRSPIQEEDEDEDAGPASSLYESAIGETREDSPSSTSLRNDRSSSASKSVSFAREGTKIFGIEQGGIVIRMWKEALPIDERPDKDNNGPGATISQGRISVDLGRIALKLDTEQLEALMTVIGSLIPNSERQHSTEADSRFARKHDKSMDSQVHFALTSLDVHYLYGTGNQHPSCSGTFWETLDSKDIQEDHLCLQILSLTADMTESNGLSVGLGGIALHDVHKDRISELGLLAQPLLIYGSVALPLNTWLPSSRDVVEAISAVLPRIDAQAQGRIRISKTGKSLLLSSDFV